MVFAVAAAFLFSSSVPVVMAQPIDYCEGNFDNDLDQDGTDAFVFKSDFGRSSLLDPCPVIECQTAEQLEMRITQLEALLANVTRLLVNGQDTIRFSGVNVQIVNGSGNTGEPINGLGNLIVSYNELRGSGDVRTGSHNVVVGRWHNYSSYGGMVTGISNTISGPYASVSGGCGNTASGQHASVSGGSANRASNTYSSVSGGYNNQASGQYASVSGGSDNAASGEAASVSGGRYNVASGDYAFVGGGGYDTALSGNTAFANYSTVLGDSLNLAGDPDLSDRTSEAYSSVSGGGLNTASGAGSSVSGGLGNTARVTLQVRVGELPEVQQGLATGEQAVIFRINKHRARPVCRGQ